MKNNQQLIESLEYRIGILEEESKGKIIAKGALAGGAGYLAGDALGRNVFRATKTGKKQLAAAQKGLDKYNRNSLAGRNTADKMINAGYKSSNKRQVLKGMKKSFSDGVKLANKLAPGFKKAGRIGGALGAAGTVGAYAAHKLNQNKKK